MGPARRSPGPHTRPLPATSHCRLPLNSGGRFTLAPGSSSVGPSGRSPGQRALSRRRPCCGETRVRVRAKVLPLPGDLPAGFPAPPLVNSPPTQAEPRSPHCPQGRPPPPSPRPLRAEPRYLQVPQMQTTSVKNRASLLVPVRSGTRCSHEHAGRRGLRGKKAHSLGSWHRQRMNKL